MSQTEIPTYRQIDRAIRGLKDSGQENMALPDSFDGHLERLVRVYASVQPLLAMLTIVPLMPPTWRKALASFKDAIEAVVAGAATFSASFKAGRDL